MDRNVLMTTTPSPSNFTTEIPHDASREAIERTFIDNIEIYILSVCFVVGAPLNLISLYKLSKAFRQSKSSAALRPSPSSGNSQINLLRIHLNIADLMTLFIYTTAQIGWLLTTEWLGGDLLCRVIKFFYTFVFYLTSFVIVCIALDRVFGAYKLSSFKASKQAFQRCQKMLIAAWVVALALSIPQLFIFGVVSPPGMPGFHQCAPIWMTMKFDLRHQASLPGVTEAESIALWFDYLAITRWERIYNICHLLFVFWIPALGIVVSYISVLCILRSFSKPSKEALKDFKFKKTIVSMLLASKKRGSREENKVVASLTSINGLPNQTLTPCLSVGGETRPEDSKSLIVVTPTEDGKRVLRRSISAEAPAVTLPFVSLPPDNLLKQSETTPLKQNKVGTMAMQTIAIARLKTKKQAVFILIAYLTLWTPYNVLAIINIFVPPESRGSFLNSLMDFTPFLNSLIVANSLVNPLIYGVFDKVAR